MDKFKTAAASAGAFLSYLFGGLDSMIQALFWIAVLDYVTGFLASAHEGKLSSQVGWKGITRKLAIFGIVAISHFIDEAISHSLGAQEFYMVRDGAICFYMANELLSIIENAGRLGIPIPDQIRNAIDIFKKKGSGRNDVSDRTR